jgi:hypothetical protein
LYFKLGYVNKTQKMHTNIGKSIAICKLKKSLLDFGIGKLEKERNADHYSVPGTVGNKE